MGTGLTREGCLRRQAALRARLAELDIDAAVLSDPKNVHYFTGHWGRGVFVPVLLIFARGDSVLALPHESDAASVAEESIVYPGVRHGTLVDDQFAAALESLGKRLANANRIGADRSMPGHAWLDLKPVLLSLRRRKDPDEVALIRRGIAACEAAYAAARELLRPGISEVEIYAELQRIAVLSVGESIGEFGNDFQSGSPGGPPRHRPIEAGELMPLDLSVVVRGYSSYLCRTFAIGGEPTAPQRDAHDAVLAALEQVERSVRPGVSCKALHGQIAQQLDGYGGWRFPHHLGHGIGLSAHEAPRLNPQWDDTFAEGDVFTAEPGLYGAELRAGVRVEQNYLVTADGVERLSSFPTAL